MALASGSSNRSVAGVIANTVSSAPVNLNRHPYPFPRAGLIFNCEGQSGAGGNLGTFPLLNSNQC